MERLPLIARRLPYEKSSFSDFFQAFWPICLISFGGPQAHVALLYDKFVAVAPGYLGPKLDESTFLEFFALAQSLPGPGSTQLVTTIGATFGGLPGALITFLIWHLPGFLIMTAAGVWFHYHLNDPAAAAMINSLINHVTGLIAAAFAFVLIAAFKIAAKTCGSSQVKATIALVSLLVAVCIPPELSSWVFITLLISGGVLYYAYERLLGIEDESEEDGVNEWVCDLTPTTGAVLIAIVIVVTVFIAFLPDNDVTYRVLKIFWRIGLIGFGGGIVVVPMLINEFVESGLLPTSVFLAGFGLFGCLPGPMFNIASFLGAAVVPLQGALLGSVGIFGPGILLQLGVLPYWERVRRVKAVQTILQGTNSAAVGLIFSGVWMLMTKALVGPAAFALTCSAGTLSIAFGMSPVNIIVSHGVLGVMLVSLGIGGPYHAS